MRWLQIAIYTVGMVMLTAAGGWVATRIAGQSDANVLCGRVLLWDLYAATVLLGYAALVGAWHVFERLTGRMENDDDGPAARG